jgi:hypothetical protein
VGVKETGRGRGSDRGKEKREEEGHEERKAKRGKVQEEEIFSKQYFQNPRLTS